MLRRTSVVITTIRRVPVDRVVAREEAHLASAVVVTEVAELLVRERLQRRRVEGPPAISPCRLDAVLGDGGFPAAGRRGHDDVVPVVEGVDGIDLELVEREREARRRARRGQDARRPVSQDGARARRLRRSKSEPMPIAMKYRMAIGTARAASEIGSPDGVITAATTTTASSA